MWNRRRKRNDSYIDWVSLKFIIKMGIEDYPTSKIDQAS